PPLQVLGLSLEALAEVPEELVGQFLDHARNQPCAELGDLAADDHVPRIFKDGSARRLPFGQGDARISLREAGNAALSSPCKHDRVRFVHLRQLYPALEGGPYGTDL